MTTGVPAATTPLPASNRILSPATYLPMLALGILGSCLPLFLYGYAPGQDLMVFHTAGRLAWAGDYATLADGRRFTDLLMRTHAGWLKGSLVLHPWVYPPAMLPFAVAIGAFPFGLIYPAVMIASLALLLCCLWQCWPTGSARDLAVLLLLLSPGTACCLGAGQVSFLIAAALLAGLAVLSRNGLRAGLVLSLLTLKPQFAILIPVALLCGGHRRALTGFASGAVTLAIFSLALLGPHPWWSWIRFITGADGHFADWAQTGRSGGQSMDAYALMLGLTSHAADLAQLAATLLAAGIVGWTFATIQDTRRRTVVFLAMATFGAPHISNYDSVLSALAAALVLTTPGEGAHRTRTVLAVLVWSSAVFNPPIIMKALGLPVLTALSVMTPPLLLLLAATMALARPQPDWRWVSVPWARFPRYGG